MMNPNTDEEYELYRQGYETGINPFPGSTPIPQVLIFDKRIPVPGAIVYAKIATEIWEGKQKYWQGTIEDVKAKVNLPRAKLKRIIDRLETYGYLVVERAPKGSDEPDTYRFSSAWMDNLPDLSYLPGSNE